MKLETQPIYLQLMTVNEIIKQLTKLPSDKLIELRKTIDPETFQLELHIVLPMEPTQKGN
jgi:hypothetical protein